MWRKFSTCEFRVAELTQFRYKIALLAVAVALTAAVDLDGRDGSKDWSVLENCRLILNPANDGDSFHVSAGAKEYIFRLYLIDAPETDELTPGRLVDQAKYFGITVPQAVEVGRAAKEFTREKLSEPFTVFTFMSDAMGQSRLERFYAFVQTKDGDLGEQLVRNGLARIYGYKAIPPGSRSVRVELGKLQQLENQAKQQKIGAWGVNAGRSPTPDVSPPVPSFTSKPQALIPSDRTPNPNRPRGKEKTPAGKIDINTATEKELTTVPGIGYVMAARIIPARPFRSADDLKRTPTAKIHTSHRATSLAAVLAGLDLLALARIFQFFTMFIIVLYDFVYALPEFCSVVSHEISSLQRLSVFMQFIVALRIGICRNSFLLTSR